MRKPKMSPSMAEQYKWALKIAVTAMRRIAKETRLKNQTTPQKEPS